MTREASVSSANSLIVGSLLLMISLTALDTTIISTAAPTIVGSLGGLSLFSWVFSIYLLTSTVTIPIFGRLADIYGRKPILLIGAVVFLVGSVLCGASQTMTQLVIFRGIQGIGAGAVQPVVMTVIGDLFSIENRAKIQGLTSGVWGVASVVGPVLGGVVTDSLSWRWIFLLNLPLGVLAIVLIWKHYREAMAHERRRVDLVGAGLLSASIICLLVGLSEGVNNYGWTGRETALLFLSAAIFLALFAWQENRTADPIVPLSLLGNRVIALAAVASFLIGALMIGADSYLPLFLQAVLGGSPTEAGLALAPMSIGWMFASYLSGKSIVRFGFAPGVIIGSVTLIAGALGLARLTPDTAWATVVVFSFVLGLGLGATTSGFTIAVQNVVGRSQRGIATGSVVFFRSIGSSVSVAMMGAILNSRMTSRLEGSSELQGTSADDLLSDSFISQLSPEVVDRLRSALAASLSEVFVVMVGAAVLTLVVAIVFPRSSAESLALSAEPTQAQTS